MADGARADKRVLTRAAIEEVAIRLFTERGYDETDVAAIAEGAGVSRRTFFRHFRQKSEVVFGPEGRFEPLLRSLTAGQPPREPPNRVVATTILEFASTVEAHRGQMLARAPLMWANADLLQYALMLHSRWTEALAEELARRDGREAPSIEDRVLAGWGISAYTAALSAWLADGDVGRLPALAERALSVRIRPPRESARSSLGDG
jgi:AcrR family transcriptional regulator